jgi:hypothetical protein
VTGLRWLLWPLRALLGRCRGCGCSLEVEYRESRSAVTRDVVGWVWCFDCAVEFKRPLPILPAPAEQLATMPTADICSALRARSEGVFVVMIGEANAAANGDDARCVIHVATGRGVRQRMKGAIEGGFNEFLRRFPK